MMTNEDVQSGDDMSVDSQSTTGHDVNTKHTRHSTTTTIRIEFASLRHAEIAYDSLAADKEPPRSHVQRTMRVDNRTLVAEFSGGLGPTRKSVNNFFELINLVNETIDAFDDKCMRLTGALRTMVKRALVVFTEGAEEMETVITVDVLRRGEVDVTLASLNGNEAVQCSRKVRVVPDASLAEAMKSAPYDAIVLPGGMPNAKTLAASSAVGDALRQHEQAGKVVAAICASTIGIVNHGIGKGATVTSHPSVKEHVEKAGYAYSESRVVSDKNDTVVTSRGPGTAFEFALKLVEILHGKDIKEKIIPPMLCHLP